MRHGACEAFGAGHADMLKIERVHRKDGELALRLAGKVTGRWCDELRRVVGAELESGARLSVDLSDVSFVDLNGVALLRGLAARDVALVNCSSFVTELLKVHR